MFVSPAISEERGFQECSDDFWAAVASAIKRHNVSFMGGDFNMALLSAGAELHKRGVDVSFLGSYVWLERNTRGGGAPDRLHDCRYDSLGLFAATAVSTIARILEPTDLRSGEKLVEFKKDKGQGYASTSYLGGLRAIDRAFNITHGRGDGDAMPHIKQKMISAQAFDAPNVLFAGGAHMPLLFYVGERGHRTEKKLEKREQGMIARGWGPSSANRYQLMERQAAKGKGKGKAKSEDKGDGKGRKP